MWVNFMNIEKVKQLEERMKKCVAKEKKDYKIKY